jgi:hypothetical protein
MNTSLVSLIAGSAVERGDEEQEGRETMLLEKKVASDFAGGVAGQVVKVCAATVVSG